MMTIVLSEPDCLSALPNPHMSIVQRGNYGNGGAQGQKKKWAKRKKLEKKPLWSLSNCPR